MSGGVAYFLVCTILFMNSVLRTYFKNLDWKIEAYRYLLQDSVFV
jgi:hypothetical protein